MTERRPVRRHHGPLVSLLLAVAPLAGAGLICAAMYYGMRLRPILPVPPSAQDSTRCVLLSSPVAADIRTWERNLYDWAALRDPTLLVLPNERFGFSRERFARLDAPAAAVPPYEFAMSAAGQDLPAPIPLCGPAAGLAERVAGAGEPIRPPPVAAVPATPLPRVTFWRFPDGRVLSDLPRFAEERLRAALASGPPPKAATALRVSWVERLSAPRVLLTGSSANAALDELALEVLRQAVGSEDMQARLAVRTTARPDFMPLPGGDVELQVEWAARLAGSSTAAEL